MYSPPFVLPFPDIPAGDIVRIALFLAYRGHDGQFRRDGKTPYIQHPRDVATRLRVQGEGVETIAVGWLHDVLEDTPITVADMYRAGLPSSVVQPVELLAKPKGMNYSEYIVRVHKNPVTRKVKIADNLSNLSDTPTDKQIAKYCQSLLYLTQP